MFLAKSELCMYAFRIDYLVNRLTEKYYLHQMADERYSDPANGQVSDRFFIC